MKVKFVGAINGVTGSCAWLKHEATGTQILVDCGMHQGPHEAEFRNYEKFPFIPADIRYVLLTHAHIDHCGLIPRLVKEGFKGWVYCTSATRDIAKLLLEDSARQGHTDYKQKHVDEIRWHAVDNGNFNWRHTLRLGHGLSVSFMRSSHVLGAATLSIRWQARADEGEPTKLRSICFSGDIGCQDKDNCYLPLLKDGFEPYPNADYLVVESTYGNTVRFVEYKMAHKRLERLSETIEHTVYTKGGKVLLPAFSFHRTQEIIADLIWLTEDDAADDEPMFTGPRPLRVALHSGLATKICEVYGKHLSSRVCNGKYQYFNGELPARIRMSGEELSKIFADLGKGHSVRLGSLELTPIRGGADKPKRETEHADVIIASSGMCDHGPAKYYLDHFGKDPRNTLVTTGFMSAGSAGKQFLLDAQNPEISVPRADVVEMSPYYSAHGDQAKLLDYIFNLAGYTDDLRDTVVFINHGESGGKQCLVSQVQQRAKASYTGDRRVSDILIADNNWFNLDTGKYEDELSPEEELRRLMRENGLSPEDVKRLLK
ncbi:MBL fold metallo-hydrolase [Marinobacter segnicrescens]|uniref:MBL fold metallo-hydrolase n=1 Tax=Marinobacter segnicrescens TaxID=430453 RepID=UPI003A9279AE